MGNEFRGQAGHSSEYFGDGRDAWHNSDFLELMRTRWRLDEVGRALDVGSGVGHWTRIVSRLLPDEAEIFGVEPESAWVGEANSKSLALGLSHRMHFQQGVVEALPFADNFFDLVTCQTVLIHVKDTRAALLEMIRVLKPGGLLAVAEPNNLSSTLFLDAYSLERDSIEAILDRVRFELLCERGKAALGLGNNSAGELLPALFCELGLLDVAVVLNDKASPVLPPYESRAEQVIVEDLQSGAARDVLGWPRDEAFRYFSAAGGSSDAFERHWQAQREDRRRVLAGIETRRYACAGGSLLYLISGRKPAPSNRSQDPGPNV